MFVCLFVCMCSQALSTFSFGEWSEPLSCLGQETPGFLLFLLPQYWGYRSLPLPLCELVVQVHMCILVWHTLTDLAVPQTLNKDFRQILNLMDGQTGL